ncbi:DUF3853 family protein [Capnocytophaga sp. ARDL2]|uniref:DUF3853 family protein n=1 Tax=Capnocytophaga sp. ARDL2 TaxID=3238809 RepID=UPI00355790CC
MINPHTPLWQLTVSEYTELNKSILRSIIEGLKGVRGEKKYEYGLIGLAKILGCSRSKASRIKSTGILDEAISQDQRTIVVDREKVLEILREKGIKLD